jgi:nitroreductase
MNTAHTPQPAGADPSSEPAGVLSVISRRVSCRSYRPEPVPPECLAQMLEAARLAPSACNRQPWRFAVVRDMAVRRRIVSEGFLPGLGMQWALEAPVHVVLGMEHSFVTHRLGAVLSGVNYPWMDLGIAGEHLVLAATSLGLGTCWIGWINPRALSRIVGWPAAVRAVAVITVGYPQPQPERPAPLRKPMEALATWL